VSIPLTEDDVAAFGLVTLHNAESSHTAGYKLTFTLKDEKDYEQFSSVTKKRKGKAGVRYRMYLLTDVSELCRDCEVFFLCWSVSNASGARIKFELHAPDDFDFFRILPAGQEWSMTLIEIDDEEKVVDQKQKEVAETVKGGPKSQMAGRLCADRLFQRFVANKEQLVKATPDQCAQFIRNKCSIISRAELDHDEAAWVRFTKWVSKPFAIWSEGQ
jgi:hypothetical protein